jgi:hypothetical protein
MEEITTTTLIKPTDPIKNPNNNTYTCASNKEKE